MAVGPLVVDILSTVIAGAYPAISLLPANRFTQEKVMQRVKPGMTLKLSPTQAAGARAGCLSGWGGRKDSLHAGVADALPRRETVDAH